MINPLRDAAGSRERPWQTPQGDPVLGSTGLPGPASIDLPGEEPAPRMVGHIPFLVLDADELP